MYSSAMRLSSWTSPRRDDKEHQGSIWGQFMKKPWGWKYRATVPLMFLYGLIINPPKQIYKKNSLDSLFLHLPLKRKPSNTVKILSSDKFFSVHDTFTPSPPLVSQKYTLFYFLMLFREWFSWKMWMFPFVYIWNSILGDAKDYFVKTTHF